MSLSFENNIFMSFATKKIIQVCTPFNAIILPRNIIQLGPYKNVNLPAAKRFPALFFLYLGKNKTIGNVRKFLLGNK